MRGRFRHRTGSPGRRAAAPPSGNREPGGDRG